MTIPGTLMALGRMDYHCTLSGLEEWQLSIRVTVILPISHILMISSSQPYLSRSPTKLHPMGVSRGRLPKPEYLWYQCPLNKKSHSLESLLFSGLVLPVSRLVGRSVIRPSGQNYRTNGIKKCPLLKEWRRWRVYYKAISQSVRARYDELARF